MTRRAAAFRQADIARAVKGARAAGLSIQSVEIDANGKIVIVSATDRQQPGRGLDGSKVVMERLARMGHG